MGLLDAFARFILPPPSDAPSLQLRSHSEFPGLEEQLAAIQRRALAQPWLQPSISEALSVPAIFRAVLLISNTVAAMTMEAWRDELMLSPKDRPRLIIRPNPLTTPREFFRDTAYAMATRGEAWWWIASRDVDEAPMSLYPVPPKEIIVSQNDANRLRPKIEWLGRTMRNEDMVQIVLTKEPGALRGAGPLQICGAAVSVSVESQEYAADFFAGGGLPSVVLKSALSLSPQEAADLKNQWMETPSNMPKVIDPGMESVTPFENNPASAQLTDQRQYQNGEAARMFGIPGSLLEYNSAGSSLTYQNVTEVWTQFQKATLSPDYLEPIEQAMSDLLTRATVCRFDLDGLLRADVKTRMEVHQIAIGAGVYPAEYAQQVEGITPGGVETAPVPFAPPQAVPELLPINRSAMQAVRCSKCNKAYGKLSPPYEFTCPRCKTVNVNNESVLMDEVRTAPATTTFNYTEIHPPAPAPAPEVHFERGAIQIDNNVEAVDLTPMANIKPAPMTVEMSNPDLAQFGVVIDKLADRPIEVNHDTKDFANAIIDLKTELARRKEIVRDKNGRIVAVK